MDSAAHMDDERLTPSRLRRRVAGLDLRLVEVRKHADYVTRLRAVARSLRVPPAALFAALPELPVLRAFVLSGVRSEERDAVHPVILVHGKPWTSPLLLGSARHA